MLKEMVENMKESSDRLDGYLTGMLVIQGDNVRLMSDMQAETLYIKLTNSDQIEVRNSEGYHPVSIDQVLNTKVDGAEDWPLFAGAYARVKKAVK